MQTRVARLEDSNKQLSWGKAELEEELHMLQDQYKILLDKIVEEQESTAKAEKQKVHLSGFCFVCNFGRAALL